MTVGAVQAVLSAKNLWTTWSAWNDIDTHSFAGAEFLFDTGVKQTLESVWNENFLMLLIMLFMVFIGFLLFRNPRPNVSN